MKKLLTENFIIRAREIHGNRYDYKLVDYINNYTKVKIICKEHGLFEQVPSSHIIKKCGCNICGGSNLLTKSIFIERANKIHENFYDYSLVEYKNNNTKIKIICPIHGEFLQKPSEHLLKSGCSKCKNVKKLTLDEFIIKAKLKHDDKYDYSLVEYINNRTKVKIICKEHGVFEQRPNAHIHYKNKQGCLKCYLENNKKENHPRWIKDRNKVRKMEELHTLSKPYKNNFRKKYNISKEFEIDHIIPIVAFVDHNFYDLHIINDESNLRALAPELNREKSGKYLEENYILYMEKNL